MTFIQMSVISPFHLSACHKNYSEGSTHLFRFKKKKKAPQNPYYTLRWMSTDKWKMDEKMESWEFFYYLIVNQRFLSQTQIMRLDLSMENISFHKEMEIRGRWPI